jgi:hypothetical protein
MPYNLKHYSPMAGEMLIMDIIDSGAHKSIERTARGLRLIYCEVFDRICFGTVTTNVLNQYGKKEKRGKMQ